MIEKQFTKIIILFPSPTAGVAISLTELQKAVDIIEEYLEQVEEDDSDDDEVGPDMWML